MKLNEEVVMRISLATAEEFAKRMRVSQCIDLPKMAREQGIPWEDMEHDLRFDSPIRRCVRGVLDQFKFEVAQLAYQNALIKNPRTPSPTDVKFAIELLSSETLLGGPIKTGRNAPKGDEREVDASELNL